MRRTARYRHEEEDETMKTKSGVKREAKESPAKEEKAKAKANGSTPFEKARKKGTTAKGWRRMSRKGRPLMRKRSNKGKRSITRRT
jgi:hypothetical protein